MWQKAKAWLEENWINRPHKLGAIINGYRIDEVLGIGSYGIAYLAQPMHAKEKVVLKQVKPSLRNSPKGEAMQVYEARILQALQHPSFPRFIDLFSSKRHHYLVMTRMQGETLELVKRIAHLVAHLHEQRIIHRDVRIPNVLLNDEQILLIDFGLARFLGDPPAYGTGSLDGYPSEKQLKRAVHPQSDLYALGHFLLFLLYSTYEVQDGQVEKSWEEELQLSSDLRQIIRRLLQHDAPYANMQEFIADLDSYLQGKTVSR